MKFAIHNLALTCVIPTTFLGGLTTQVQGQVVPATAVRSNVKLVENRASEAPPRLLPRINTARPIRNQSEKRSVGNSITDHQSAMPSARSRNPSIQQVANQAQQRPPQTTGGESDVQRQLRALYEKSGQEMPVMDLNELEVPEPQAGVVPEGGPAQGGQSTIQGPAQPQEAPKKPSFFERVFLGKKAPPAQPQPGAPGLQRPASTGVPPHSMVPQGGNPQNNLIRPGQMPPQGYRPYTPNPPSQPNTLGQRPGMNPSGSPTAQPNPQAIQRPQTGLPDQRAAQGQSTPQQNQQPPQQVLQSQQPPQHPQPVRKSDIPVLEDEPEESLEIDVTPRAPATPVRKTPLPAQQPVGRTPVPREEQPKVVPAPTPPQAAPVTSDSTTTAEENPFSGLRLSIPEPAAQKPAAQFLAPQIKSSNVPVITPVPVLNPAPSDANNPFESDPVLSGRDTPAAPLKPASRTVPAIPVSRRSAPQETANPFLEPPATGGAPLSWLDENLRRLAAATEKVGFKGFCPVMLRQYRTLVAVKPQFNVNYRGKKFRFSSADAKAQFEKSPELFAPAYDGLDGVALMDDDKSLPGSLDHAAWYHGRLYMFATRVNLELFNAEPDMYEDDQELEKTVNKGKSDPSKQNPDAQRAPVVRSTGINSVASPSKTQTGSATGVTPSQTQPAALPAGAPKSIPQKSPSSDEPPVLADDIDTIEPVGPTLNGARTPATSPALPDANLNGLKLTVPAAKMAPKSKPAIEPLPQNEGPKLEGPKLQGPKLSALAAPIKPAGAVQAQESNPAPRLIKPAPKHGNPQGK